MEWVIVAVVVVVLLVTIGITVRQRSAVRAQQEQLRQLETKLDGFAGGQQVPGDVQSQPPAPNAQPPSYQQPSSYQQPPSYEQPSSYPQTQPYWQAGSYPPGDPAVDPRFEEVRQLVRDGRKIEAIKVYRELTRVGLKEAKETVERMGI